MTMTQTGLMLLDRRGREQALNVKVGIGGPIESLFAMMVEKLLAFLKKVSHSE